LTGSNDGGATQVMPIPVITGDLVNPGRTGEPNKAFVFYDPVSPDFAAGDSSIQFTNLTHISSLLTHDGDTFKNGTDGWFWLLDDSPSRKIITRPLVLFDEGDSDMWIFIWTAFAPGGFGECKSAGQGYAYFRMLANGSDVPPDGKWKDIDGLAYHAMEEGKPGDVTVIGAPTTGILPATSSGGEIYTIQDYKLLTSAPASYLKWYELY
jgi:hypothetical protein